MTPTANSDRAAPAILSIVSIVAPELGANLWPPAVDVNLSVRIARDNLARRKERREEPPVRILAALDKLAKTAILDDSIQEGLPCLR
jgi:hypothetical protein